ncbi:glycosyltransferase family 4 protein [Actinosynnema sp. NPDC050801]|uniref:glycosyltransferase family 4 protein n=1 Tax=unclassified Actinosynnema TaxID=2637065 RepID=UPI0033E0E75E
MRESGRPLRIGMVAPPWLSIPPDGYGGIESVVATLVDGLVDLGHEVTLFAAGPHGTKAQHAVRVFDEVAVPGQDGEFPALLYTALVSAAVADAGLDLVHEHTITGLLAAPARTAPTVHTVHNPVHARFGEYLRRIGDAVSLVALTDYQIECAEDLNWVGRVFNAIDTNAFRHVPLKDDYLLYLGRITPEKGVHVAIDAARAAGRRIVVAGRCAEPREREYFEQEVGPRLGPGVEWFGHADFAQKAALLGGASGVLCPFQWPEPFCMVIPEALACGTPVVALRRGSAAELVVDGYNGYAVDDAADLPSAIAALADVDPRDCRRDAEERFGAERMARAYQDVYRAVLGG